MIRNLSIFWSKVVFLLVLIFITSSVFTQIEYNVEICETQFITKKYAVTPLPGYTTTWILDPQLNNQGSLNTDVIFIKWENVGNYTIIAQYSNGDCISQNEIEIIVQGCPEFTFYIPNAFTPNGEGISKNELFGAYGIGVLKFQMDIFNRWGELVFHSDNIEQRWDGYYMNKICEDDIYLYRIVYRGLDNKEKIIYGRVLLIK